MSFKQVVIVFLALVSVFAALGYASNVPSGSHCTLDLNATGNYILGSNCVNSTIAVSQGIDNASLECETGSSISYANFSNDTYNDTLFNCSFSDAKINLMYNAQDNIISPSGSYNTSVNGNISNLGVGYYFNFIPLGPNGNYSLQGFTAVMPDALVKFNPGVGGSQGTTMNDIIGDALQNNYTLPRFGDYPPGNVSLGPKSFAVEAYAVYNNHTFTYNPYFFISPFWGWDELTFKVMNITSDVNFTPTLVYPRMTENVQFPDNTSIYWNYTVVKYSNATNMTFYFWKGYQVAPNGKVMYEVHNITNGSYDYNRGVQTPGIHETIAVLKSPEALEHDNSTTETYGIGLSYCTQKEPDIFMPGYYTMSRKYLGLLNVFWATNITCSKAVQITSPDITINCLGGTINSTNSSIIITHSGNVTLENCRIEGNAITGLDSNPINIYNSTIVANNATNVPFVLNASTLNLYGTKVAGYSRNASLTDGAVLNKYNTTFVVDTTTIDYNTTTVTTSMSTTTIAQGRISNFAVGIYSHIAKVFVVFLFFVLVVTGLYMLVNRSSDKK